MLDYLTTEDVGGATLLVGMAAPLLTIEFGRLIATVVVVAFACVLGVIVGTRYGVPPARRADMQAIWRRAGLMLVPALVVGGLFSWAILSGRPLLGVGVMIGSMAVTAAIVWIAKAR